LSTWSVSATPTGRGPAEAEPMQVPVSGAPNQSRSRTISRRRFLMMAGGTSSLVLLAACSGTSAPAGPPAPTQEPLAARTQAPIVLAQNTPVPAAAPAVGRAEAKGKFSEAWNTTLSPAWLDPQEN